MLRHNYTDDQTHMKTFCDVHQISGKAYVNEFSHQQLDELYEVLSKNDKTGHWTNEDKTRKKANLRSYMRNHADKIMWKGAKGNVCASSATPTTAGLTTNPSASTTDSSPSPTDSSPSPTDSLPSPTDPSPSPMTSSSSSTSTTSSSSTTSATSPPASTTKTVPMKEKKAPLAKAGEDTLAKEKKTALEEEREAMLAQDMKAAASATSFPAGKGWNTKKTARISKDVVQAGTETVDLIRQSKVSAAITTINNLIGKLQVELPYDIESTALEECTGEVHLSKQKIESFCADLETTMTTATDMVQNSDAAGAISALNSMKDKLEEEL